MNACVLLSSYQKQTAVQPGTRKLHARIALRPGQGSYLYALHSAPGKEVACTHMHSASSKEVTCMHSPQPQTRKLHARRSLIPEQGSYMRALHSARKFHARTAAFRRPPARYLSSSVNALFFFGEVGKLVGARNGCRFDYCLTKNQHDRQQSADRLVRHSGKVTSEHSVNLHLKTLQDKKWKDFHNNIVVLF